MNSGTQLPRPGAALMGLPADGTAAPRIILTLSGPSVAGQVAAVTGFLEQRSCYIDEIAVFDDSLEKAFFMRCVFHAPEGSMLALAQLRRDFDALACHLGTSWSLHDAAERARVVIMVSKFDHCLNDLLYRWRIGELKIDIVGIVSNHETLASVAAAHAIPFHYLPVTPETKMAQEAVLLKLVEDSCADLVVLARYMQILSADLSASFTGRAINIHHSFLPGFKGSKPYHQAHARGVKLIGATAHYVTHDLDEGPIIEQVVERVDHSYGPTQLQAIGRDMECVALSRAVRLHIERRTFVNGNRTVVLR
jgi:formyltetrahydrofolate deformylase